MKTLTKIEVDAMRAAMDEINGTTKFDKDKFMENDTTAEEDLVDMILFTGKNAEILSDIDIKNNKFVFCVTYEVSTNISHKSDDTSVDMIKKDIEEKGITYQTARIVLQTSDYVISKIVVLFFLSSPEGVDQAYYKLMSETKITISPFEEIDYKKIIDLYIKKFTREKLSHLLQTVGSAVNRSFSSSDLFGIDTMNKVTDACRQSLLGINI